MLAGQGFQTVATQVQISLRQIHGQVAQRLRALSTYGVEGQVKLVAWLFLLNTVFSVAKMVRDKQEADLMEGIAAADPLFPVNDSTEK